MKKLLLFITISTFTNSVWSQKEGNVWYFGNNAGISFNSTPAALTDGKIAQREGCATICGKNGNLLFYTDGQKIYDNTHTVMSNGSGLLGNGSSCQSAIIVPWPDSTNKYFVVSVDAIENSAVNGVRYSVVDMTLNGGKGDVVSSEKNIVLIKPQCEKVTLIRHSNKKDFWLVTNQASSDSIFSFAVTSAGINKTAVRSNTGVSLNADLNNNLGYLCPSHDGSKLASCHFLLNKVLLMDFNNQTGKVSNVITLSKASAYCAEFSPNNKILYVSGLRQPTSIDQFDITLSSQSSIQASVKQIFDYGSGEMGALKLGPDGKIYVTSETTTNGYNTYLGAISSPNSLGINCGFNAKAVSLGGKTARLGLPNNYDYSINFTGINRITEDGSCKLSVYPNPSKDMINIRYSVKNSDAKLILLNVTGEEIFNYTSKGDGIGERKFEFSTQNLVKGIYFVKLEDGTGTSIQRIIITE